MGFMFSKYLRTTDVQEPEPGNGVITMRVDRSFLDAEGSPKLVTPGFQIGGRSWAVKLVRLEKEKILVELQNKDLDSQRVCCILSVVGNNADVAHKFTVMSGTSFPEYPFIMEVPLRPASIAHAASHLVTSKNCFSIKLNLRVRPADNQRQESNEQFLDRFKDNPDTKVIKWRFRYLSPFDRCTFESDPFRIHDRTLRLKFCPRGLSGAENTASIYLCNEAGAGMKVHLACEINNVFKAASHHAEDFSLTLWDTARLANLVESHQLIDEEFGYLDEGWLTLLVFIKLVETDCVSPSENFPKKPKDWFSTTTDSSQQSEENENRCLVCGNSPVVATVVHDDGLCRGANVCTEHERGLRGGNAAICPRCHEPFDHIDDIWN